MKTNINKRRAAGVIIGLAGIIPAWWIYAVIAMAATKSITLWNGNLWLVMIVSMGFSTLAMIRAWQYSHPKPEVNKNAVQH